MYLLAFCKFVVGLVFVLSFVTKAVNIRKFEKTIANFKILPERFSKLFALLFLAAEFNIVVLVVAGGGFLWLGFTLAALLLTAFCCALLSILKRNLQTSCNCFGSTARSVSMYDVWRNVGFILLALVGLLMTAFAGNAVASFIITDFVLTGLIAAVFTAVWINLGEIARLLGMSRPSERRS